MANKTALLSSSQNTLQRGKACLRCRKRKMRCDGSKPSCQQCVRAKKGDACEYDDGKGKTRTQILKETIARLENRIHELEDPEYVSPAITLHDPHVFHHSESSSSSLGSPGSATYSASHSPFRPDTTSPSSSWINLPQPNSTSPFASEIFYEEPQISTPFDLAPLLLNIFAPHRHQCGLEVHVGHLRESLNLPSNKQRHPALMNAIYLWACFVSRPEPLCEHEEYFLGQALEAQQQGLRLADKVLDVIQASCLLSLYFLANGRLLEGSYHSSAAAALAVQVGLHMDVPQEASSWLSDSVESFDMKPTKSDYRRGERVLAFWQVYNLDRCWSVVLRKPAVIPDGSSTYNPVNCPWPQDIGEYESGYIDPNPTFRTLSGFLSGDVSSGGYSLQTLRVKASTLFAHADMLSKAWGSDIKTPANTQDQVHVLEMTIITFLSALTPVHQLDSALLEERYILVTVHTLAHTAMILLFQRLAYDVNTPIFEKCMESATRCLSIVKSLSGADFGMLDPILGTCWTTVGEILVRQLDAYETAWTAVDATALRTDLTALLFAMTNFNSHFPILDIALAKLKTRLEV